MTLNETSEEHNAVEEIEKEKAKILKNAPVLQGRSSVFRLKCPKPETGAKTQPYQISVHNFARTEC